MHKFDAENLERLLSEDRLGEFTAEEVLRDAGLTEGMVFVDVGCGPGFFSIPASSIVGEKGTVYAVDTQKEMLAALKERGLAPNVKPVISTENSIPLGDEEADFALAAYVLHEAEEKRGFLGEVRRLLKPGGRLLVIDWDKVEEENGPPFEDRVSKEEASGLVEGEGFGVVEGSMLTRTHYRLTALKEVRRWKRGDTG